MLRIGLQYVGLLLATRDLCYWEDAIGLCWYTVLQIVLLMTNVDCNVMEQATEEQSTNGKIEWNVRRKFTAVVFSFFSSPLPPWIYCSSNLFTNSKTIWPSPTNDIIQRQNSYWWYQSFPKPYIFTLTFHFDGSQWLIEIAYDWHFGLKRVVSCTVWGL